MQKMIKLTRILVLGATGMLGSAVLRYLAMNPIYEVYGTIRTFNAMSKLQQTSPKARFIPNINVDNFDCLTSLFARVKPDFVINCVGIVKQLEGANDPILVIPINTLLPHRLARLSNIVNARLIHLSTDCVFSGKKGNYSESDIPDACDLYGRSKLLGEVDYSNSITLRTSIIGHELTSSRSLIDWFLAQEGKVPGYRKAVFSGLPTVEIARIIDEHIIPNQHLNGLYHLSAEPISKLDLLSLVANIYQKNVIIQPTDDFVIDRSLNSDRFRSTTGFRPEPWPTLISRMHAFR